ncbi:AAA family ATPase [Streptomyces sp. NPDC049040]|uniref:helix-turn-helix transcriptional regulator n=1 Tax=Streptomyces sp. NPDC049040 TaxID=3365593 RepID=UPI003718D1FF
MARQTGSVSADARLTGRGALLTTARTALDAGDSVLLTGEPGIGRTTVVAALAAERPGTAVLRCAPTEAERHLPFLGLIDLLSEVRDEAFEVLSPREQALLRAALHRSTAAPEAVHGQAYEGAYDDVLTLRMAVLKALTALCERSAVLLVLDDAQWLDGPSAQALAFVARRSRRLPLTVIAAVRTPYGQAGAGSGTAGALCPAPVLELALPPMTEREVAALLAGQDGPAWPRRLMARLHAASGGNPYAALELSRALAEQSRATGRDPSGPLPIPRTLRRLLLARLAPLTPQARRTLLAASAAARPTLALLRRAGCDTAPADVREAIRLGVVEASPSGAIRFTQPLMPRAVYEHATAAGRRRVHAALAEAADDPLERAHHLASLSPGWNAETAAALTTAATTARRRGAPAIAARLGQLAADRTPSGDPAADADRRLTAAEDAVAAGDYPLARGIAHEVLAESGRPADRVRAWIVVVDSCGQAMAEVADVFPQALEDARDDPELLARLHYRLSWRAWVVEGSAAAALTHAARSAVLARRAGDRRTELLALTQQAALEFYLGRPCAERTLTRALAAPQDPGVLFDHNGPVFLKHRRHLLHDRLDDARTELRALVYTVRHRGSAESLCQCLSGLAQVEIMRGRCEAALDLAHQALRVTEQAGLSQGPAWYAVALAEAAGGSADRALAAADLARRHSEDDDDQLFLPRALHAEGHVRLLRGEPAAAVHALQRVRLLETGQGQGDPAVRRWQPDLVEALVATGCADEAAGILTQTRAQAARLGRQGLLAVLDRSAALVTEARGDPAAAAARLERAADRLAALPYRMEEARTHLVLGRLHARHGATAPARAALAEAVRLFTRAGARPWLAVTTAALDHLDVPQPAASPAGLDSLTATEHRVALLVAQGASNREIAARLTISVKTVEAALTRAYRKLSVRSRVSLARAVMTRGGPP